MSYEAWQLGILEKCGYGTTQEAKTNKLARYLSNHADDIIDTNTYVDACNACGISPGEIDLDKLQKKLNNL